MLDLQTEIDHIQVCSVLIAFPSQGGRIRTPEGYFPKRPLFQYSFLSFCEIVLPKSLTRPTSWTQGSLIPVNSTSDGTDIRACYH